MSIVLTYLALSLLVSSPFLVAVWRHLAGRMPQAPTPPGPGPR
ncbi:hypothetical protein ACWGH7_16605 [Streptomyces cyaneofuscatus]